MECDKKINRIEHAGYAARALVGYHSVLSSQYRVWIILEEPLAHVLGGVCVVYWYLHIVFLIDTYVTGKT
jgi:hypothetical protein